MKDYLQKMIELRKSFGKIPEGYFYSCAEDYVLDHGKEFSVRELTSEEQNIVNSAKRNRLFPERQCFDNAQRIVLSDKTGQLNYIEGFATAYFPVLHAWVAINSVVIDPTWERIKLDTRSYYGVEFKDRNLLRLKNKDKFSQSIIDDWKGRFPIFKEPRLK